VLGVVVLIKLVLKLSWFFRVNETKINDAFGQFLFQNVQIKLFGHNVVKDSEFSDALE